jgi:hypothetical protein
MADKKISDLAAGTVATTSLFEMESAGGTSGKTTAASILALSSGAVAHLLDTPPAVAHAKDDEFTSPTLDVKWTSPANSLSGLAITQTQAGSWIFIEPATAGTSSTGLKGVFGIRQAAPTGSFTITCKSSDLACQVNSTSVDASNCLWVATSGGKGYLLRWNSMQLSPFIPVADFLAISTYSDTADWSGWDAGSIGAAPNNSLNWTQRAGALWARLIYDAGAGTLTAQASSNGLAWITMNVVKTSVPQPTRMGIGIYSNSTTVYADHKVAYDWFRVTEP